MNYILMNLETMADGFLLTLGLHAATIFVAIVETIFVAIVEILIVCLLALAFYPVLNVVIRLAAWRHNKRVAKQKRMKEENEDG